MSIAGVYHIKGGVGKTTSAVNFAYLSAREERPTLLWDLDPQGSATYYFNLESGLGLSAKKLLKAKTDWESVVQRTAYPLLDVLPADFSYRKLDVVLNRAKSEKDGLRSFLKPLTRRYELIILDCPPGITLLSENIFRAVDFLLVPNIPTTLCLRSYVQVLTFFRQKGLGLEKIIPFFSMVETRKRLHRENVDFFTTKLRRMCRRTIPYLADIERMGLVRQPVPHYLPQSPAAQAFVSLWEELRPRLLMAEA
ncbi:MAG: ParA family protein [Acidobacteria bacterium]|nr:ParA family protein [Acidobacteriota bacterium]